MAGDDPEILAKLATLHNAVCEAEKALDDDKDALREGSKVYRDDVACAREDLRAAKHERDRFLDGLKADYPLFGDEAPTLEITRRGDA